ncbi:MAG: histidine kinase N-terminal 7TM domain-containing protein, partial [Gemmobacter sp.]
VLLLLLWVRAQRFFFGKGYFLLTFVAMLVWLGAAGLELWATEFRCKLFFAYLAWPGITLLPTAWVLFLADYAFARTRVPGAATRALLILAPLAVAAAAFTNPWHGLFYGPETRMVTLDGRASVVFDHGPLFFVAASYLYVILAAAVAICSAGAFLAYRAYRSFFLFMLFITLVPLAGNVGYVAFGFTLMGFDPTPFLFSFVLFVFTGLIFTNRVFDIGTIAKDMLFYETRNPILVIDAGGTVAAANPAALEAFGATAAAVGGRLASWPVVGFAGPMLAARAADRRATPIGAGGRRFEMLVLPISGPLDRRGAVLGWVIHAFDVTERAGLEAVLAADRDYLATLMDTSISGIIAIDAAGVMVFANAEACRILGRPQADIEGRRFDDPAWGVAGIDGKPFDSGHLPFAQVRALRSAVRDVRFSILWPDGTRRAIAVNAAPTDPGRGPARVVCAIADITERLASEEALRQAAERAEAASRTKSRFVANMSHEIRTPLNGVLGMAEVLERSVTDPEQARMVATIRDSGALLLNVLNDILDMSKIEADRLDLERIPFRPAEIAGRVSGLHVLRAGEKGLDFRIAATGDADRPRLGD